VYTLYWNYIVKVTLVAMFISNKKFMCVHKYVAYFITQNYNIESFSLLKIFTYADNEISIDDKSN